MRYLQISMHIPKLEASIESGQVARLSIVAGP